MGLDLVALRAPAPVLTLPNGAERQLHYLRGDGYALLQKYAQEPSNVALLMDLLRAILPDATDADFDSLGFDDMIRILGLAQNKLQLVEAALKNGPSDGVNPAPSPSPASNPTTFSRTSSDASPARTGARGKRSTTPSGIGPSLPGTP